MTAATSLTQTALFWTLVVTFTMTISGGAEIVRGEYKMGGLLIAIPVSFWLSYMFGAP